MDTEDPGLGEQDPRIPQRELHAAPTSPVGREGLSPSPDGGREDVWDPRLLQGGGSEQPLPSPVLLTPCHFQGWPRPGTPCAGERCGMQLRDILGDVDAPEGPELLSCPSRSLECSEGTMWGFSTGALLALPPPGWLQGQQRVPSSLRGAGWGEKWSSSRSVNRGWGDNSG